MSDESTTTIKFGDGPAPWYVAKGTVSDQRAQLVEAFGMLDHNEKTLAELIADASTMARSLYKATLKAAAQGYRPPTSIKAPQPPEPEPGEPDDAAGPVGLAALVKTTKTVEELESLYHNNKDIWTDELNQLATEQRAEIEKNG